MTEMINIGSPNQTQPLNVSRFKKLSKIQWIS